MKGKNKNLIIILIFIEHGRCIRFIIDSGTEEFVNNISSLVCKGVLYRRTISFVLFEPNLL